MTILHKRPYWIFSVAVFVVWAIVLPLSWKLGGNAHFKTVSLIFYGYFIGWLSASIARKVYK
jgi:hypothetical protein